MVPSCDHASSALLCAEDNSCVLGFDDEDDGDCEEEERRISLLSEHKKRNFYGDPLTDIPPQSDECLASLVERESEHMPREDYAERLRSGALDSSIRTDAIDRILKVHAHYNFGPLSAYLSVNYLDRFLSNYELPKGKAWMTQLLSVACLSLAAKMEETEVPLSLDFQVGEANYVFEAKTIQRMELLTSDVNMNSEETMSQLPTLRFMIPSRIIPPQSDECLASLVERESEHMPREDYAERLRSGALDSSIRTDAIDRILKVHAHYNFGPLSAYLSVNYLDRFLSNYELPKGKAWMTQLLSVACLSLAAKMEETEVPLSLDFQVGEANYVFEAKTIQRMELLVLSTLKWRMQALTPFSFIDFFLHKFSGGNVPTKTVVSRSMELILSTVRGADFLAFRPSEIAAAITLLVSGERQPVDVEKAVSCCLQVAKLEVEFLIDASVTKEGADFLAFRPSEIAAAITLLVSGERQPVDVEKAVSCCLQVAKEKVLRCCEVIKDMELMRSRPLRNDNISFSSVPPSSIGVSSAVCLSCKDDDLTVESHATSHHNSSATKRRKPSRQ
ncbi:hypothetical protein C4D60_Mb07t16390 [Musa balbisiana]|uniref:Cyclin N-terminal domain-containing protein n=1 Tax=Musa balbisiana TaxID=52838 RepID=A0A4S8JHP7_MUSBA|nr:hypothetical protein C4D60_Mb07t16390 [Musa balbisiana]